MGEEDKKAVKLIGKFYIYGGILLEVECLCFEITLDLEKLGEVGENMELKV
ncbi:hypothetical protein WN943_026083 [Citrus x changshan-huyou]